MRISDWSSDVCSSDLLSIAAFLLIAFYVGNRLVLMVAKARFGRGLHAMHPLDAAARTWIARRNVNLVIITAGLLLGQAEAAFYLICGWQGATMLWHAVRTAWLIGTGDRPAGRSEEHTSELQSLMRISSTVYCSTKKNKT